MIGHICSQRSHLLSQVRGNRYSPSWKGRSWWYSSGFRGFAAIIIIIIIITVIIGIGITITITIGPGGTVLDSGSLSPGGGFPCPHSLLDEQDAEVVFFLPKQKKCKFVYVFFLQLRIFHRSGFESRVQRPNQACKVSGNMIKSDDTSLSLLLL